MQIKSISQAYVCAKVRVNERVRKRERDREEMKENEYKTPLDGYSYCYIDQLLATVFSQVQLNMPGAQFPLFCVRNVAMDSL